MELGGKEEELDSREGQVTMLGQRITRRTQLRRGNPMWKNARLQQR